MNDVSSCVSKGEKLESVTIPSVPVELDVADPTISLLKKLFEDNIKLSSLVLKNIPHVNVQSEHNSDVPSEQIRESPPSLPQDQNFFPQFHEPRTTVKRDFIPGMILMLNGSCLFISIM